MRCMLEISVLCLGSTVPVETLLHPGPVQTYPWYAFIRERNLLILRFFLNLDLLYLFIFSQRYEYRINLSFHPTGVYSCPRTCHFHGN